VGPFPSPGKMVRVRGGNRRELMYVMKSRLEEGVRSRERGCSRVDWYRDDAGDGEHAVE
jgi:quinol monooxygenase YgiN